MPMVDTAVAGRPLRNHPAASHDCGITNSDHPHSTQTRTSGEGVIGGWLRVRGVLRYKRISAGITETESHRHLGQVTAHLNRRSRSFMYGGCPHCMLCHDQGAIGSA